VTAVVACTPTTQQRKEVWQMPEGDAISSLAPGWLPDKKEHFLPPFNPSSNRN
jgi:hypothetical protein